jgi:hypothetical protein
LNTPELDQLYRRYRRYERLAKQYNMVLDERTGDSLVHLVIDPVQQTLTPVLRLVMHVVAIPKTILRDRPAAWYVAKYVEYRAKADNAHDLYWALTDATQKTDWEGLDREGKLAQLHHIGERLKVVDELLAQWRAKVPAWELKQAEQEPPRTTKAAILAWMDGFSDPHPMIATLEDAKRERETERDWLLDQL